MPSEPISNLLREARRQLGISQLDLARRCGVSKRLISELENGQRPNVGMNTVLRLMQTLGVAMRLSGPGGSFAEILPASAAALGRQARAARRRASWSGGHAPLHQFRTPASGGATHGDRLAAVSQVSRQAHLIARSKARKPRARSK